MTSSLPPWLSILRGQKPLIISFPHTGTQIPAEIEKRLISPWLGRKDADWWVDRLYDFAEDLGVTLVRTEISRTVIDVNRDPTGTSLYPGQETTGLCPTTTFDGELLYRAASEPDTEEVARRRQAYFAPYHHALTTEIERLRESNDVVILYEAHSIRSRIPRLFDDELPNFNIGTNEGRSCAKALTSAVEAACDARGFSRITNGRFKGGYTTRHYGSPETGVHALQMELACRGYMIDPPGVLSADNWPSPYDASAASPLRSALNEIVGACLTFARGSVSSVATSDHP